jgi:GxxExxY protein
MSSKPLIFAEESYQIVGLLFEIYNKLGFGYQEKYYQRAFMSALQESGLSFKREQSYRIGYKSRVIGRYFVDFVVDNKIAVEIKVADGIYKQHLNQLLSYLKHTDLRLGLLAVFTPKGLLYKRVAN